MVLRWMPSRRAARTADQPARVVEHDLALLGGRQVLAAAVHQLIADAVLERLDAAAECRLGKVHRHRSGDEAAVFVKGEQVAKLAEIDVHGQAGF